MTTYDYRPNTGPEQPGSGGASGAADQARQAAGTAADEGKHVAEVAKGEAQQVASDVQAHARDLLGEARTEVQAQTRTQLDSLVGTLQGFAEDLEKMARGEGPGSGLANDVVQQVGDKARAFSSQLQDRDPSEILDQARDFARRKPGTFLLGALAAGVVAGRLARGAKDAQGSSSTGMSTGSAQQVPSAGSTAYGTDIGKEMGATQTASLPTAPPPAPLPGTATADPLAGSGHPTETPAYPEGTPSSSTTQWGTP